MFKGAIFDLDGTLTDSMPVWANIGRSYLESKGIAADESVDEQIKSMSFSQSSVYFSENYGTNTSVAELQQFCKQTAAVQYQHHVPEKPGACAFVRKLAGEGLRLCVATAADRQLAEAALARLEILDCFSFVLSCNDLSVGKDTPEIYDTACGRLGLQKNQVLVFEDAFHAALTAKRAGYRVVGIEDESAVSERTEIQAVCDYYLADYRQAAKLLMSHGGETDGD